jgi:acetyl esterase
MPLDNQTALLLKGLADSGLPPFNEMDVPQARAVYAQAVADHGITPEPLAEISERTIPGPAGDIPIRVYRPSASPPQPVLVYFHGGGWTIGDLDVVHGACTVLANRASAIVVSVDYRLAPEHPFPAAVEDAWAATRWVAHNAAVLEADAERIAVGGDSAGGTLAAVVSLLARDAGGPNLAAQLLYYPAVDTASMDTLSHTRNGDGYFLTSALIRWFYDSYLPNQSDREDWRASPLRASDLSGLAPALVYTAEYDPLLDEGEAYAARLAEAGTPVVAVCDPGQIHAYALNLAGSIDAGKQSLERAGRHLRHVFRNGWSPRPWLTADPMPALGNPVAAG